MKKKLINRIALYVLAGYALAALLFVLRIVYELVTDNWHFVWVFGVLGLLVWAACAYAFTED